MDKSADEMQEYLDTGSFPDADNNDNEDNTQVRRRNTEPLPRRSESRATSRRAGM